MVHLIRAPANKTRRPAYACLRQDDVNFKTAQGLSPAEIQKSASRGFAPASTQKAVHCRPSLLQPNIDTPNRKGLLSPAIVTLLESYGGFAHTIMILLYEAGQRNPNVKKPVAEPCKGKRIFGTIQSCTDRCNSYHYWSYCASYRSIFRLTCMQLSAGGLLRSPSVAHSTHRV